MSRRTLAPLSLLLLLASCEDPPTPQARPPSTAGQEVERPWRPFADTSPWNTPVPGEAQIHPDSDHLVQALAASATQWPGLHVSIHPWSVPVYYVDPSTPLVDVYARLSNEGEHLTLRWPVPRESEPAPETDGHMTLVDRDGQRGYDFFQARPRGDGPWDCTLCATIDLSGSGIRPPQGEVRPWYRAHGSRACGFPLIAGLITPDEIRSGRIDHALVIAYPGIRQAGFVAPASTGHPANGRISRDDGIPCGGRIQLDPTLDVASLDLPPAGRTIARALQEYGAFVGDFSETINLYADGSARARAYWAGRLDAHTIRTLDLARFRVIAWGQMHDPDR